MLSSTWHDRKDGSDRSDCPPEADGSWLVMSRKSGIFEDPTKRFRCFLISLRDEVRVDVEGRAGVSMAQSARNGAHVDAGGEKPRRNVVPEIMEANARHPGLLTDPAERSGGRVGVPW